MGLVCDDEEEDADCARGGGTVVMMELFLGETREPWCREDDAREGEIRGGSLKECASSLALPKWIMCGEVNIHFDKKKRMGCFFFTFEHDIPFFATGSTNVLRIIDSLG